MGTDELAGGMTRRRRTRGARPARCLPLAAFGQAIAMALTHGVQSRRRAAPGAVLACLRWTPLPLCLLALAATVPLLFLRPVAAAVAVTVDHALVFAAVRPPLWPALVAS